MHFHLPKPLHGWREFAGEVGIIVLGVLIALGAEQVVQAVRQRSEARDAESEIRAELEQNIAKLKSRSAVRACVDKRIAELQDLIGSGATGGPIVTPNWVGRPQFWTMQMARAGDVAGWTGGAALAGSAGALRRPLFLYGERECRDDPRTAGLGEASLIGAS